MYNLFQCIRAEFERGFEVSPDVMRYINSTLSDPSIAELEAVLSDEGNCEREPISELLFFPDESFQISIEPILEPAGFLKADELALSQRLGAENIRAAFRFPNKETLFVPLTHEAAYRFVSRLRLSYQADLRIRDALERYVAQDLRSVIKVRLRNACIRYNEYNIKLLCDFYEKLGFMSEQLAENLEVMLNILSEPHAQEDIHKALEKRRDFYTLALQKATESEEQFGRNNIETLMVQGVRSPHIDRNEVMRQIVIIERLSYFL